MMSQFHEADQELDQFMSQLARHASADGWSLVRIQEDHSDRSFELRGPGGRAPFTAKISLTEKPFWGLTAAKAAAIAEAQCESLLLVTDGARGYFLSPIAYLRALKKFSRTKEGAVRINPNTIKAEARFGDADDAFELLKARAVSPAA